jgi:hypothetical protein
MLAKRRMGDISFSLEMANCYGLVPRASREEMICAYMLRACKCFCADLTRLVIRGIDIAAVLRRGGNRTGHVVTAREVMEISIRLALDTGLGDCEVSSIMEYARGLSQPAPVMTNTELRVSCYVGTVLQTSARSRNARHIDVFASLDNIPTVRRSFDNWSPPRQMRRGTQVIGDALLEAIDLVRSAFSIPE